MLHTGQRLRSSTGPRGSEGTSPGSDSARDWLSGSGEGVRRCEVAAILGGHAELLTLALGA